MQQNAAINMDLDDKNGVYLNAASKEWKFWCRLCAREEDSSINIFLENNEVRKSALKAKAAERKEVIEIDAINLVSLIEKYFLVKMTLDENLPHTICRKCFLLIKNLETFNENVLKTQMMFKAIDETVKENLDIDLKTIRCKYTLLNDVHELFKEASSELDSTETEVKIYKLENELVGIDAEMRNPLEIMQSKVKMETPPTECIKFSKESTQIRKKSHRNAKNYAENSTEIRERKRTQRTVVAAYDDDEALLSCTLCSNKFKRIQGFRIHMKKMHGIKLPSPVFQCSQCSSFFTTNFKLKKHLKLHVPLELRKVVQCLHCDKKFTTNFLMQTHIKHAHKNELGFICEECGMALKTNGALKRHMLTHTDYAAFACEICHRRFKHQFQLNSHMEIHDPTKHVCAECGLELSSRRTLHRHLLVHSDEMPYKCDYCGRNFKRSKSLKIHLIIHSGIKPYACNFCDVSFSTSTNCRLHMKKIHTAEFVAQETEGGGSKRHKRNIPSLASLKASFSKVATVAKEQYAAIT